MATSQVGMSFMLDPTTSATINHLAVDEHKSSEQVITDAISAYVARRNDLAELKARADRFDRDGLHLTGEEVDAWLLSWENGEDTPMPECHV